MQSECNGAMCELRQTNIRDHRTRVGSICCLGALRIRETGMRGVEPEIRRTSKGRCAMSGYVPDTEEVRDSLVYLNKYHAKQYGDVDLMVVGSETAGQFDRWLADVRRQAAEEAWDEGYREANEDLWRDGGSEGNPYKKAEE